MRTAAAAIKGFEAMRMIGRGHCILCALGVAGGVPIVAKLFDVMT